jgi:transposase-like protein
MPADLPSEEELATHEVVASEITCPYCGDTAYDSTGEREYTQQDDVQRYECGSCNREYLWSWEVEVVYTSRRLPPEEEAALVKGTAEAATGGENEHG